ncbi:MAG TPA: hypothetical protein VKD67_00205 [Acidimicrobiales bacterium]|nr:hypothetical protein [Acidimicrobiales bacterium]
MRSRGLLTVAALAVAAVTVAVAGAAAAPDVRALAIEAGVLGWVLLGVALVWNGVALTPAMLGLGVPAALIVVHHHDTVPMIVPAAALLVATGELAGWSLDRRSVVPEGAAVAARRLAWTAGLTAGAAAVAAGVLAISGLPAPGGALPLLAGATATVAIVALAALRRW